MHRIFSFTVFSLMLAGSGLALEIRDASIVTSARLELTRAYAKRHYGLNSYRLERPRMIVIHYTVSGNLRQALDVFRPERLSPARRELQGFGEVNVGAHFLVDKDGTVYSLLPTDVMGRHAVGFNHCAIGIENVARRASDLTPAQLKANVALIHHLLEKHSSLRFLAGHHELRTVGTPHATLYLEMDPRYQQSGKSDPGTAFMKALRERLAAGGMTLEP